MQKRRIAVIGSTGGNLFSQGGKTARALLNRVEIEGLEWGYEVTKIIFLCASQSLDNIQDPAHVVLITKGFQIKDDTEGELKQINEIIRNLTTQLGDEIRRGLIDAFVSISADPKNVNRGAFEAAKERNIPIVASGASSVAWIKTIGCNLVYATGTTGTSTDLRAINYMAALARYWQDVAWIGVKTRLNSMLKEISFGFETWCLPYFLAIVILEGLTGYGVAFLNPVYNGFIRFSPLIACLAVARPLLCAPGIGTVVITSLGVMASLFNSGFIGGTVFGFIGAIVLNVFVYIIAGRRLPGSAMGLLVFLLVVTPLTALIVLTAKPLNQLSYLIAFIPVKLFQGRFFWIGLAVGAAFWPLFEIGLYHKFVLPLILLEISVRGTSIIGAFDLLCLVVPAVGACISSLLTKQRVQDGLRTLFETVMYGTNVEYVYTFTDRKTAAKIGLYILCGVTGLFICKLNLEAVGYLPVFLVPFIVQNGGMLAIVIIAAILVSSLYFSIVSVTIKKS